MATDAHFRAFTYLPGSPVKEPSIEGLRSEPLHLAVAIRERKTHWTLFLSENE
jgi:hypothetical protein